MTSKIIKITKEKNKYIVFNERGMVLELTSKEHALLQKHMHDKQLPKTNKKFFNQLCKYEMLTFEDYIPTTTKDTKKDDTFKYSQKLLKHNSTKPVYASPIVAHLGITRACNMQCKYCSIRKPYEHNTELTTEEWKTIIKKVADLGTFQIGFTGGEPTLRKDIVELANYVTEVGCTFNLTTNGWNVSEQLIIDLKKAGMRQCQISLDSHVEEINDKLRTKGSYKRVIKTIELLKKHELIVGIDCVVSNNNIDTIKGFIDWLTQKEVPFITLIKIKQGDLDLETFKSLLPEYNKYSTLLKNVSERNNENPNVTIDCGSVSNLQAILNKDNINTVPVAGCPVGHTLLSISPNADMFPCVALSQDRFKIGNALTDNLKEIWNKNSTLKTLRQVKSKVNGKCKTCYRLNYCRGGCRGIVYSLYNDLWLEDKTCNRGGT